MPRPKSPRPTATRTRMLGERRARAQPTRTRARPGRRRHGLDQGTAPGRRRRAERRGVRVPRPKRRAFEPVDDVGGGERRTDATTDRDTDNSTRNKHAHPRSLVLEARLELNAPRGDARARAGGRALPADARSRTEDAAYRGCRLRDVPEISISKPRASPPVARGSRGLNLARVLPDVDEFNARCRGDGRAGARRARAGRRAVRVRRRRRRRLRLRRRALDARSLGARRRGARGEPSTTSTERRRDVVRG